MKDKKDILVGYTKADDDKFIEDRAKGVKHSKTEKKRHLRFRLKEVIAEWKWLLRYVKRYFGKILIFIAIGVAGVLMSLEVSVATKNLIDSVIGHDSSTIGKSTAIVLGLSLCSIVVKAITSRVSTVINVGVTNQIRGEIFDSFLRAKWSELSDYHSGEMLNRLEGDVSNIVSGIITLVPNLITQTVQFVGVFCVIFYYDSTMALLSLCGAPILIFSSRFLLSKMSKFNKESREVNGKILSYNEEAFQNVQFVKAFGLINEYTKGLKDLLTNYRSLQLDYNKFTIFVTALYSVIGLAVYYGCWGWGVFQLWRGLITYGVMTMFLQLSSRLTNSFSSLVGLVPSAVSTATSAGRIMELLNLPAETDSDCEEVNAMMENAKSNGLRLKADNISFKYPDAVDQTLSKVNFEVNPGEIIAFVGLSGGGKTTILRMLLGLLDIDEGELTFTDCDGKNVALSDSTRRFCSYVPQEIGIFSGSIASNLRAINPEATDEEIIEALKTSGAYSFIEKLPKGIDSTLKERGVNLSQGQLQRISIARSLMRDAPVMLLDEATSALDPETEKVVLENILKSNPNRTVILTTHRQSMLDYCNRIYRVSDNTVTELV